MTKKHIETIAIQAGRNPDEPVGERLAPVASGGQFADGAGSAQLLVDRREGERVQ